MMKMNNKAFKWSGITLISATLAQGSAFCPPSAHPDPTWREWGQVKACYLKFPPLDISLQQYNTEVLTKSVDEFYAFADLVQGPTKLDPDFLKVSSEFSNWTPQTEQAPVDYAKELKAIGATNYTSLYQYQVDVTNVFSRFYDGHTGYSPGVFGEAVIATPWSFDLEVVNETLRVAVAPRSSDIVPKKYLQLHPNVMDPLDKAAQGVHVDMINGAPALETLRNWADMGEGFKDSGVRLNSLLLSLKHGVITPHRLGGPAFPNNITIRFVDGESFSFPLLAASQALNNWTFFDVNLTEATQSVHKPEPKFLNLLKFMMNTNMTSGGVLDHVHEEEPSPAENFKGSEAYSAYSEKGDPTETYRTAIKNSKASGKAQFARDLVKTDRSALNMLFEVDGTPVLKSTSFYSDNLYELFPEVINLGKKLKSKRLIIDFTGNGGGIVYQATGLLSLLIEGYDSPETVCGPSLQRVTPLKRAINELFQEFYIPDAFVNATDIDAYVEQIAPDIELPGYGYGYGYGYAYSTFAWFDIVTEKIVDNAIDKNATLNKIDYTETQINDWLKDYHTTAHYMKIMSVGMNPYNSNKNSGLKVIDLESFDKFLPKYVEGASYEEKVEAFLKLMFRAQLVGSTKEHILGTPNGCNNVGKGLYKYMNRFSLNVDGSCYDPRNFESPEEYISFKRGLDTKSTFYKPFVSDLCGAAFKGGLFEAQFNQVRENPYYFPEIVVLTDGYCASACSHVVSNLQQLKNRIPDSKQKITVVSYGGLPGKLMDSSSVRGGIVQDHNDLMGPLLAAISEASLFYKSNDTKNSVVSELLVLPLLDSASFSMNTFQEMGGWNKESHITLPLEWMRKPADYHWDKWYTFGTSKVGVYTEELHVVYRALARGNVESPPDLSDYPPLQEASDNVASTGSPCRNLLWWLPVSVVLASLTTVM